MPGINLHATADIAICPLDRYHHIATCNYLISVELVSQLFRYDIKIMSCTNIPITSKAKDAKPHLIFLLHDKLIRRICL